MGEVKNLSRVEEPLELLQKLSALVSTRTRVDEDQDGRDVAVGNGLDGPQLTGVLLLGGRLGRLRLFTVVSLAGRRGGLAQAALEVALPGYLDDPRGWDYDGRVQPELAALAYFLGAEAGLAVVVGPLAPAAAHGHYFLGGETQLGLEGFGAVGTLALLRAPVDPVVVRDLLLSVLPDSDVPVARLAAKVQA